MGLLDLSLEFELEALGDLWSDLREDLLDLVLGGEFALFEFGVEGGSFPFEVLETGPAQQSNTEQPCSNFHQQIHIYFFHHVHIHSNRSNNYQQQRIQHSRPAGGIFYRLFSLVLFSIDGLTRSLSVVDHVEQVTELFFVQQPAHYKGQRKRYHGDDVVEVLVVVEF